MNEQHQTLALDNVQVRATIGSVTLTGWMQVSEQLAKDTAAVLTRLQEGNGEPWLAPRHGWMIREGVIWSHFDNVATDELWTEYDRTAAIARKAVAALERCIEIIVATNGESSYRALADRADRLRAAGIPIIAEGKEQDGNR